MDRIEPMPLAGAAEVHSRPFNDHRGSFVRLFCEEALLPLLGTRRIRQINYSTNLRKGTLRGLHYQIPPHSDMKFVRCVRGTTYHAIVDIRPESPTYLKWHAVRLDAKAMNMICVPEGFAHGFQSLQDNCELMYFVTSPYVAAQQAGLRYDDPALAISWPLRVSELSERDAHHPLLDVGAGGAVA